MQCELIPFSIHTLSENGITCSDFYQEAAYVALDAKLHNGQPFIFIVNTGSLKAAVPVILRNIPSAATPDEKLRDAVSPYGYPGILFSGQPDAHALSECISGIQQAAFENKIVSVFLRLHPFYNAVLFPEMPDVKQVFHGHTVYIDLQLPVEEIRKAYSTNHKRDIKSLTQKGFTTRINDKAFLADFYSAYTGTMQFVQAGTYYHFSYDYFQTLSAIFGDRLTCISAHTPAGDFVSGAIFIETAGLVQYHLGGTPVRFRTFAGSKLVFDAAIDHFHHLKKNILHLGGGFGSTEDALFRFKTGFSKQLKQYSTLRMITDREKYHHLSSMHASASTEGMENFFPAYRK